MLRAASPLRLLRIDPFTVLADQINEALDGFAFGNVEFHRLLANVKIDLVRGAADVAEVGIRHLAGTVHYATHDRDLHTFEMLGALFDPGGDGLEIEEGAAATR